MEVSVVSAKGLPPNSFVSMGIRQHRVMRPADSSKPCQFPSEDLQTPGVLKVEVLSMTGSSRLVRQPGSQTYSVSIPNKTENKAMEIELAIAALSKKEPNSNVEVEREALKGAQGGECQKYLEQHKLTEFLQAMVKGLLEVKPEDPYAWIADQVLSNKRLQQPEQGATSPPTKAEGEAPPPAAEAEVERLPIATVRQLPKHRGGACVVTGPSGVGKSTLIKKLMEEFPTKFGFSVSHTTRQPRPGEVDGVDYHYSDRETMEKAIAENKFIEHAEVHGNLYGTSIAAVESVMNEGKICLLDIDVQGAESVRKSILASQTTFVFFAPPTLQVLEQRLRGRGTETEERIQKRLSGALRELRIYEDNPDAWHLTIRWFNEEVETAYAKFRTYLSYQVITDAREMEKIQEASDSLNAAPPGTSVSPSPAAAVAAAPSATADPVAAALPSQALPVHCSTMYGSAYPSMNLGSFLMFI